MALQTGKNSVRVQKWLTKYMVPVGVLAHHAESAFVSVGGTLSVAFWQSNSLPKKYGLKGPDVHVARCPLAARESYYPTSNAGCIPGSVNK